MADSRGQVPHVSCVVRSVGRPELRRALASLSRQDYPFLEVLVVDATGGSHPPLPAIRWREGHSVRLVGAARALNRPAAANAGLDSATGLWVFFLDDDDSVDPTHVSGLLAAARAEDVALYGRGRLVREDGTVAGLDGLPFNMRFVLSGRLCPFGSLLFRRSALGGCRFDEALVVCEDRDFIAQVTRRGAFRHVDPITFNYHVEAGHSGTAPQGRRAWLRAQRFADRVCAHWYGDWAYSCLRPLVLGRRGAQLLAQGRGAESVAFLEGALREHPEDPSILVALGLAEHRGRGRVEVAAAYAKRAIAIDATRGEYRLVLAEILLRQGRADEAVAELQLASTDDSSRPAALQALRRLGRHPDARPDEASPAPVDPGSGLVELRDAMNAANEGRDDEAYEILETVAALRGDDPTVRSAAKACFETAYRPARRAAAIRFFDGWLQRHRARGGEAPHATRVHVVGSSSAPEAMRLGLDHARGAMGATQAEPWCVDSPAALASSMGCAVQPVTWEAFPREGALVVAGYRFNLGLWLFDSHAHAATLLVDDTVEPERLVDRAVELDCIPGEPALGVAYASEPVAASYGLPGLVMPRRT